MATVMVGCVGGKSPNSAPTSELPTSIPVADMADPVIVDVPPSVVGQEVLVDEVTHLITLAETMPAIPIENTLDEWSLIAEELPAEEGFQWIHIEAEVTNRSDDIRTLDATSVVVMSRDTTEFLASPDTIIYIPTEKAPFDIHIQPEQTVEWEAYFMVPVDGTYQLRVNDLNDIPEMEALINL